MKQLLHILNGDSTLSMMNKQKIAGDKVVWREVLCEGKTIPTIGSPEFWKERIQFFESFFEVENTQFKDFTIKEFDKLKNFQSYDEVVLWFEHDLFCQINMIAMISWLAQQNKGKTTISLVCLGEFEHYEELVALGEIDSKYYPQLFDQRKTLEKKDFAEALTAWKCYCSDQPSQLLNLKINGAFPYLQPALKAHLKRFPSVKNGLNFIENNILHLAKSGVDNPHRLVGKLLKEYPQYGFGDLQYYGYIKRMLPLFESIQPLVLNDLGKAVVEGDKDFQQLVGETEYLGGANIQQFRWDENQSALLEATV